MFRFASILISVFFLSLHLPSTLFAWGGGHDLVAQQVAKFLPEPWCSKLAEDPALMRQFLADAHYPDSMEDLELTRWGEADLKILTDRGMKNRYGFHQISNVCLAFQLLVDAIRNEDEPRVFLLTALISHTLADQTSFNHEPLTHYATYTLGNEGLGIFPSGNLDLSWVGSKAGTRKVWEDFCAQAAAEEPAIYGVPEVWNVICRAEWAGYDYAEYGAKVASLAWAVAQPGDYPQLEREMAEAFTASGLFSVRLTLNLFRSAVELAKTGEPVVWSGKITDYYPDFQNDFVAYVQARPAEKDGFCVPFLPKAGEPTAEFQILYDSTGHWAAGFFSPGDRIFACMIAGTLRKNGKSAQLLDVRKFNADGVPEPEKVRCVIVPAQVFHSFSGTSAEAFLKQLADWREAGGRILWVGNSIPAEVYPEGSRALDWIPEKDCYAVPAYPVPLEQILDAGIGIPREKSWKFQRVPAGKAGWFWPSGRTFVKADAPEEIRPAVEFLFPDGRRSVIGFTAPKFGFVPTYALSPYYFTEEKPVFWPLDLKLDSAGEEILLELIRRLE
ncbi:MAG: hypothetical protein IJQ31_11870 [Thermoguttaceae bacterium]|nr:hypothetical protein [Thermoguttaceae bacterium]